MRAISGALFAAATAAGLAAQTPATAVAQATAPTVGPLPASFRTYGRGCAQPGQPLPRIGATTLPVLGTGFTVFYAALPAGQTPVSIDAPALVLGLNQALTPVPTLSSLQPANCNLLVSQDIVQFLPFTSGSYPSSLTLAIPSDAGLLGTTLHLQWAELYSRCSGSSCVPMMIRVTDAATATIGA